MWLLNGKFRRTVGTETIKHVFGLRPAQFKFGVRLVKINDLVDHRDVYKRQVFAHFDYSDFLPSESTAVIEPIKFKRVRYTPGILQIFFTSDQVLVESRSGAGLTMLSLFRRYRVQESGQSKHNKEPSKEFIANQNEYQ